MKTKNLALALLLPFLALLAFGARALEPNGTAIYSELGSQLYLGTLFLDSPSKSADEILNSSQKKRMEIRFSGTMSKRRWAQTWTQSIAINSDREDMVAAANDLSETLSAFQGNLEYGDSVIIDYDPLYGTAVSVNGVKLVTEKSAPLFKLFLSSWIGPVPPNSQFKNAILGASDSKNDYTAFLALKPSAAQLAAVQGWNTKLKEAEEQALADAKAEEEAIKKAEEEAEKKAEEEALAEQQKQELIAEEKRKAQEAARKAAEEAEAARKAAELKAQQEQQKPDEDAEELSAKSILAQQEYTSTVIGQIYKHVKYPSTAVKRNQQDTIRALISVDRGGNLTAVKLVDESKFGALNKAVEEAIAKAGKFPALPETIRSNSMDINVPVSFKLE